MSTVYNGADAFAGSITIPSDGDDETAASVDTPLESLQDAVTYLNNRKGPFRLFAITSISAANPTNSTVLISVSNVVAGDLADVQISLTVSVLGGTSGDTITVQPF